MQEKQGGKISIKAVGLIIILAVVFLLLISNTIYAYRLPTVNATLPFSGKLTKTEKSKGTATWSEDASIYVNTGGKVEEVYVKEGQTVEKGQKLFTLSFDKEQLQQSLKELEVNQSIKQEQIASYNIQIETNNRHLQNLKAEDYSADYISDYDIRQLESEIEIAEKDVENLKILYDEGIISKNEYETAVNELEAMKTQKDELESVYNENINTQNKDISEKEKERTTQISDYEAENESLYNQIAQLELDIKSYDIQKETYQSSLNRYEQDETIYAEEYGELTSFSVEKGQQVGDGYYAGQIGYGETFDIDCELSLNNNFVAVGDTCKVKNINHSFEGIVSKITLTEGVKIVTVSVASDEISTGETFDITFEKESEESYTLVPNGALNMDSDGYFLYQVKRRDGILGQEYYTQKLRVYIGDSDDTNTVITKGLSFFEPVVLTSNKAFSESQSVNLKNAGDFFEN